MGAGGGCLDGQTFAEISVECAVTLGRVPLRNLKLTRGGSGL